MQTQYPLIPYDSAAAIPSLDQHLAGIWDVREKDAEARLVRVKNVDAGIYELLVIEQGVQPHTQARKFLGWTAHFEGLDVLVLTEGNDIRFATTYYLYEISANGARTIRTRDITLPGKGPGAVTSTAAFQEEVRIALNSKKLLSHTLHWKRR